GRRVPVLIAGEAGSGRTTAACALAGDEPRIFLDAIDVSRVGDEAWGAQLDRLVRDHRGLIVVEAIHLLPPTLAIRLARLLETTDAWLALTSASMSKLSGEHANLATHCLARVDLPPLRSRRVELPHLIQEMLRRV